MAKRSNKQQSQEVQSMDAIDGNIDELEKGESGGILLVKPTTFMNESGRSVRKVMDFYKLDLSDLWVVHDDLDIPLRKYKIVKGVGPRGHKGVLSVENHVGKSFWRVRVGVENRKDRSLSGEDYTLMNFGKEEREVIDRVLEEIVGGL